MTDTFAVGCCDLEWTQTGKEIAKADLQADQHLVGRLWYPASKETQSGWFGGYTKCSWLPAYNYAYGFTNFLFLKNRGYLKYAKPAFTAAVYSIGKSQAVPAFLHAPIAGSKAEFPLIIFSHGIGGNRIAYSAIICSLVKQGYVVFSVEHADGTGSAAKLAYKAGWLFYQGWGSEDARMAQTRYRVGEVLTAYKLLSSMSRGEPVAGLSLSGGHNPDTLLAGKLDVKAVALAGHSYGGATVTALCSQEPAFKCTIALDPWWGALLADQAALEQWKTNSPILIMGSHKWNTPNAKGQLACGGDRQARLLQAVRYREQGPNGSKGGGAVLLVIKGTAHHTFTDVVPYFHARFGWLTRMLGFTDEIEPALSLRLISGSMLAFLNRHLPLTEAQRSLFKQSQGSVHSAGAPQHADNHNHVLAAASRDVSDASRQIRGTKSQKLEDSQQQNGQMAGMQAGAVANGGFSDEHSNSENLSGRTCEFRVKADEREVFEQVCKGHIAKLELSL